MGDYLLKLPPDMIKEISKKLPLSDRVQLQSIYPSIAAHITLNKKEEEYINHLLNNTVLLEKDALDFLTHLIGKKLTSSDLHQLTKHTSGGKYIIPYDLFHIMINWIFRNTQWDQITAYLMEHVREKMKMKENGYIYSDKYKKYITPLSISSSSFEVMILNRLSQEYKGHPPYDISDLAAILKLYQKFEFGEKK